MGWIIVIEDNLGAAAEISDSISQIDPKISIVSFGTSKDFLTWMSKLQEHDPEASASVPKDRFLGLVTSTETWHFKDVRLIGKFKSLFVQKKMAEKEDDLFVVFTGYMSAEFQKKRFEYKSVNNFVCKPFDKLVLKQVLEIAINGRQPTKTHFTHVLKSDSEVEMLKEIEISEVGELSFSTRSEQRLQSGTIAKYYADFLETKHHRSALAQVLNAETDDSSSGSLNVKLRFFALDQAQSFNIQKLAQERRQLRTLEGLKAEASKYEFVFLRHDSSPLASELEPSFERFFEHPVTPVSTIDDLHRHLNAATADRSFVFIETAHIAGNEKAELEAIKGLHPKAVLFLLSPRIFPEAAEKELSSSVEDIFYAPFNRSYIVKGLKLRYPDLANKEDLFEHVHATKKLIHVSNPVKLVEISETDLIIAYHRELPVGSFREFILWLPAEIEVPTLLAQCNDAQKSADGKSFNCHFIFFALSDHELKFIRRWMLLQYVEEKQKEA